MNRRKFLGHVQYEMFIIPALVSFTLFTVYPLIRTLLYSFTDFNGVTRDYAFVGFSNYLKVFQDDVMKQALFNTLFYTLFTTLLIIVISIPLAVLLDKPHRIKTFERAVFFFPSVVSALLIGYIWGYILSPLPSGALNKLLNTFFGLKPTGWLSDPWMAKMCIIGVAVWTSAGWHTVVNLAYLQSISPEYYEAASIDGATRFQQFRYVTIPLLAPALTVNTLLLLTNGLKVYDLPYALTKGGPGYANYTVTQIIIQRGISEKQYGVSTALAGIFILLVMVISVVQFTTMRKREENIT